MWPIKRADRLIFSSVFVSVMLVWLILVGVDALGSLIRELDEVGSGNYHIGTALTYIALTLPRRAYEMFGTAAAVGALMGLGAMAPTAELTAMRAGGMSIMRICASAVVGMGMVMLLVMLMGETIAPAGEEYAQSIETSAKSQDVVATGKSGLWARESESLINAKSGRVDGANITLFDVRVFEFTDQGQLLAVTHAARAEHKAKNWMLLQAKRWDFAEQKVTPQELGDIAWQSTLDPRLLSISIVRPRYLNVVDLLSSIDYMQRNKLDASAYQSALWARIFYPLSVLSLLLASLPFAFGMLRSGGFGLRMVLGIILAVSFFLLQRAMVNLSDVYGLDVRLAHLLPSVFLLLAARFYFKRVN